MLHIFCTLLLALTAGNAFGNVEVVPKYGSEAIRDVREQYIAERNSLAWMPGNPSGTEHFTILASGTRVYHNTMDAKPFITVVSGDVIIRIFDGSISEGYGNQFIPDSSYLRMTLDFTDPARLFALIEAQGYTQVAFRTWLPPDFLLPYLDFRRMVEEDIARLRQ